MDVGLRQHTWRFFRFLTFKFSWKFFKTYGIFNFKWDNIPLYSWDLNHEAENCDRWSTFKLLSLSTVGVDNRSFQKNEDIMYPVNY